MNYFKLLFFYFINIVDAVINLACALVHYYPSLELAQEFLLSKEMKRIEGEIGDRTEDRMKALDHADAIMKEAKALGKKEEM